MSFGFGIGDIITCMQMAWKTIDALRSAGSEFEGLRLELASLTSVLSGLEAEAKGPMPLINTASQERQEQMRLLLRNCTASMQDLQRLVTNFNDFNPNRRRDFMAWMKLAAKDKRSPRDKLAVHTASINIFLTTLSHSSLARLEFLIKNGPQRMTAEPGSEGQRGFGLASSSHHMTATSNKGPALVWQQIGSSLADEGIGSEEIERFQDELKAYARYLVRGETPFWATPKSARSRDRRETEMRFNKELEADLARAKKEQGRPATKPLVHNEAVEDDWTVSYSDLEPSASLRISLPSPEARSNARDALINEHEHEHEEERKLNRARRERLREEVRVAHEAQDIASGVRREGESRLGQGLSNPAADLEEVVALAEQFENLFELQAISQPIQHGWPVPQVQHRVSPPLHTDSQDSDWDETSRLRRGENLSRKELRSKIAREERVYKIRNKLQHLREKHARYLEERRFAEAQDLEDFAIPSQLELLKKERVHVLPNKARREAYRCDACHFWIPGFRYHCGECQGSSGDSPEEGNWDICEECWDMGARCPKGNVHEMMLIRE